MESRNRQEARRLIAYRIARHLLPHHRKDWAEAMFNEVAYLGSRRAELQWTASCVLAAFRERVAFELESTFMTRRIFKVLLGTAAAMIFIAIGFYIDAKPYQRERMWIAAREAIGPGVTSPRAAPPSDRP